MTEYTDFRAHDLVAVGGRLLLLGTEGRRHGMNENAWVYAVDTATGELKVIRRRSTACTQASAATAGTAAGRR